MFCFVSAARWHEDASGVKISLAWQPSFRGFHHAPLEKNCSVPSLFWEGPPGPKEGPFGLGGSSWNKNKERTRIFKEQDGIL